MSETGTYSFDVREFGYGSYPSLTVNIANDGNRPTGSLAVALSGTNASDFSISSSSVTSLAVGATSAVSIHPALGLGTGTWTATLTVSGAHAVLASFDVSFTVNKATPSYTPPYGTTIDFAGSSPCLGDSTVISVVTYINAGVVTEVLGAWTWDTDPPNSPSDLTDPITQMGIYQHDAIFTPTDTTNFPIIKVADVSYTVVAPIALITVAPQASQIDRLSI